MTLSLQLILAFVALVTFFVIFRSIRKSNLQIEESFFWLLFSTILLVLSIFPSIIIFFSKLLGFQSPANFVFLFIIFLLMVNQYKIKSNSESSDGRYDISLIPRAGEYPGMIMELKSEKGLSDEALEHLAVEALKQIKEKRYETEMQIEGVKRILKLGIAFSGKKVLIQAE